MCHMTITATEFKTNFGKYLTLVQKEDILITKNGKIIGQFTLPQSNKLAALRSLIGLADNGRDASLDESRDERLARQ